MTCFLDVPVRRRDALRALWAAICGRTYFMRVELIGPNYWRIHE